MAGITGATNNGNQSFLNEVARQSYGSGVFEKGSGGEGNIGLFTGQDGKARVVKFNTHSSERGGVVTDDMLKASNALRQSLLDIAVKNGLPDSAVANIRKALGLAPDQSVDSCKKLLTRKVTAAVIKAIGGDNAMKAAMAGVSKSELKSTGSTKFDDVNLRNHFGTERFTAKHLDKCGLTAGDLDKAFDRLTEKYSLSRDARSQVVRATLDFLAEEAEMKEAPARNYSEWKDGKERLPNSHQLMELIAQGAYTGTADGIVKIGRALIPVHELNTTGARTDQLKEMLGDDLVKLPFAPGSAQEEKFCAATDKIVKHIMAPLNGDNEKKKQNCLMKLSCVLKEGEVPNENNVRRAVLRSIVSDPAILRTLSAPGKIKPKVFQHLMDVQGRSTENCWKKIVESKQEHDLTTGFYDDFVRAQTDDKYYAHFTFNGERPPVGTVGDALDTHGRNNIQQTNAGLQRMMKEMIPDPKVRALVTSMCGAEGGLRAAIATLGANDDLGYGKLGDLFKGSSLDSAHIDQDSFRFDLTVDKDNNLIFKQSVNATPGIRNLLDTPLKDLHGLVVSENEISMTVKIPLNQVLAEGQMPVFEILDCQSGAADVK